MMDRLSVATQVAIHVTNYIVERDGDDPKFDGWSSYRPDDKADIVAQQQVAIDKLIEMGVIDAAVFAPDK
jgi:hypothetical protein